MSIGTEIYSYCYIVQTLTLGTVFGYFLNTINRGILSEPHQTYNNLQEVHILEVSSRGAGVTYHLDVCIYGCVLN